MKLTFIIPPQFDGRQPAERTAGCTRVTYLAPNIYELTVAAELERLNGVEVAYRDFVYKKTTKAEFDSFLKEDIADAYIMWTVNLSVENDLTAIESIRKQRGSKIPVILLGPGAAYYYKKCLTDEQIYIVRGEPEETAKELVKALRDHRNVTDEVKGLYLKRDGAIKATPTRPLMKDLDSLSFPALHFIKDKEYHNPKLKKGPYMTMVTSRNCPYHCIYCVPSSLTFAREIESKTHTGHKPPISYKSIATIEKEVGRLASMGYKAVGFMDDNFIWNFERTQEICRIMKHHDMVWGCQARVDAITEPIARILGASGCKYVDLGVESFDDRILKYIKKGICSEDIFRAISLLKKYDVPVKLNVLIGSSPLETKETVRETFRMVKQLDVDQVMFNIVSPFPGTEYYKEALANGWIENGEYVPTDVQRNSILNLPNLSARGMERLLYKNNLSYFLSPRFVIKQIKRFSSIGELSYAAKALKLKLFG